MSSFFFTPIASNFLFSGLDFTGSNLTSILTRNHSALQGLTTGDDHTQYAFLAGRSGGQTLIGGTAASNSLTLQSTSNATKGSILFGSTGAIDEVNGRLGVGVTNPSYLLHLRQVNTTTYTPADFNTIPSGILENTSSGAGKYTSFLFSTESNGEVGIGAVENSGNTAADFVVVTRSAGSRFERLRLLATGEVGIGTSTPATALDVNGSITARTSLLGGAASGGNLTLGSTSHATKGKILFGTSAYDEVNNRLGIGTSSPASPLHVKGGNANSIKIDNDGSQYTEIDLANNGTVKASWYWDNVANNTVLTQNYYFAGAHHGFAAAPLGYIGCRFTYNFTSDGGSSFVAGLDIDPTMVGASGDTSYQVYVNIAGFGITTQSTDTVDVVAALRLAEPQITLGGGGAAITVAATLYIAGAPTEGVANAALYVASGTTFLGGLLDLSAISAGNPNLKITATSDTPTTTWNVVGVNNASTAPAGYLEILVGASVRYIPFFT